MRVFKHRSLVVALLLVFMWPGVVFADSSSSTNYQVDQTFFGSGGLLESNSANYQAKQTLGELGVGLSESAAYRAYAGFNTTDEPYIEFFVDGDSIDLGALDFTQATTTSGTFYVRAWQASGYVVQTASEPPENVDTGYKLTPMTTGGTSNPGTEQFGINLVLNDEFCGVSCDLGADPVQVPDATFSFGQPSLGYDTDGTFQYNQSDEVAFSSQSTSVTIYTVSYLFNISFTTPSGLYKFNHNLVATGTY